MKWRARHRKWAKKSKACFSTIAFLLKVPMSTKLAAKKVEKMAPGVTKMLGERETQAGQNCSYFSVFARNMPGLGLAFLEDWGVHFGGGLIAEH